ncbi:MAG TPA: peptidoglycan editing factor PgeF [Gammaproteobacteria bacterium]|nr:peptidoglycan editing factor PgeF [Gammaproteobacteria bacterium]
MNYIQANWSAPTNIKAYTTLRSGWRDQQPLATCLLVPAEPIWIKQTHGICVVKAVPENNGREADAVFTNEPHQVCAVTTADCLPLLICHRQGSCVAAIHAGWRGLAAGIIEATLDQLQQSGEDLLVWMGPAIGPEKFEVGQDVYDAFTSQHSQSVRAFIPNHRGQWFANLYELAKIRLKLRGVTQVVGGHFCTYTQQDLFFSYRRDKGTTGRMASMIWIENDHS